MTGCSPYILYRCKTACSLSLASIIKSVGANNQACGRQEQVKKRPYPCRLEVLLAEPDTVQNALAAP